MERLDRENIHEAIRIVKEPGIYSVEQVSTAVDIIWAYSVQKRLNPECSEN